MKTKLFRLIAIVICSSLLGCKYSKDDLEDGVTKSPSYVQIYTAVNDFDVNVVGSIDAYILTILFKGERINKFYPPQKEKFDELAKFYNDESYTGYVMPGSNEALAEPLSYLNVVCDKDFDSEHKAGQKLDDIVYFYALSAYEFIQRGYKGDATKKKNEPDYWSEYGKLMYGGSGHELIEMPINEVNQYNSHLIYPVCELYFKKKPATSGEYVFTVTIKIGNTEIKKEIKHSF